MVFLFVVCVRQQNKLVGWLTWFIYKKLSYHSASYNSHSASIDYICCRPTENETVYTTWAIKTCHSITVHNKQTNERTNIQTEEERHRVKPALVLYVAGTLKYTFRNSVPRTPVNPVEPTGPVKPVGPVGPDCPVAPVLPVLPGGPSLPENGSKQL